jgi:hypothetical protein
MFLGLTGLASAVPILNPVNGHYYDVINLSINWADARAAAETLTFRGVPGHLVTIDSAAENLFITNTFGADAIHYHWIGGFQPPDSPEPDGGWSWITGESFVFNNWAPVEPNNFFGADPNEDRIVFDHQVNASGKHWNDLPSSFLTDGFVAEFPVPEPGTLVLFGTGIVGLLAYRCRRSGQVRRLG